MGWAAFRICFVCLKTLIFQMKASTQKGPQRAENTRVSTSNREFKSERDFKDLVQRVKSGKAAVKLRKLFLYRGSAFNVMQEVWIQDKHNPDAQGPHGDPLKEFAVVHVHHHAGVRRLQDVDENKDLDVVDAMNSRHLAATGAPYQNDNPFFSTFIEPSGRNTLKVYRKQKDWTCSVCRQTNFSTKPDCQGRSCAPCTGTRPDASWDWKRNKHVDEGLAEILAQSEQAWKSGQQWQSGQASP